MIPSPPSLRLRRTDGGTLERHLLAQIRAVAEGVVAERVARLARGDEDEELVVGHVQAEVVAVARLVAGAAGAVEFAAGVDARGGDVAPVEARDGVAGSAGS
jgi:hypothetical protein